MEMKNEACRTATETLLVVLATPIHNLSLSVTHTRTNKHFSTDDQATLCIGLYEVIVVITILVVMIIISIVVFILHGEMYKSCHDSCGSADSGRIPCVVGRHRHH